MWLGCYNGRMKRTWALDEAVKILRDGGVGVMPTDTVYGLVARAADKAAVARLYGLKRRERKPGTLIAASVEQLLELGAAEADLRVVERFWPASLSVVVELGKEFGYLQQGLDDLPVRVPGDEGLRRVLERTGPLATTSANQPGEPTAESVAEAWDYFGDGVDFYVDGGELKGRAPSTIVRVMGGRVEVLREGAVKVDGNQA
jgi:L-threonylcarbamoyladenylate synthase